MTRNPTIPAPRVVRSATITFGLVAIPTKLYTSNETADDIHFSMLHEADGAPVKQVYRCTKCNELVDKEHIVRGYEHGKGSYCVFTPAEFEALSELDSGRIKVEECIAPKLLDPVYMAEEKTYYLGPDKGGDLAFATVRDALKESKLIAIATYGRNGKERLVAVRPFGEIMILHELRYAREVKGVEGVPIAEATSKPAELRVARQLLARMTNDVFAIERYSDSIHAKKRELIQKKIESGELITVAPIATPVNAADMIEALKASLDTIPDRSVKRLVLKRDRKARAVRVSKAKKRKAG